MAQSTAEARQEVENARRVAGAELNELGEAARAAIDIPAKVRRNPLRVAGLASGLAFLALGGPKRVLRAAESRFWPSRQQRVKQVLPDEVARVVNRLGDEAEAVRDHLERDFVRYLEKRHPQEVPNARRSLWKTYDTLLAPIGGAAAAALAKRLFESPADRRKRDAEVEEPPPSA